MKRIILISLSILFMNCGSDNNVTSDSDKKMIKNIVENIIKPQEKKFYNDAIQLQELTNKFVGTTTAENLEQVRNQWFVVAKDWARCFAFNIGEVEKGKFFIYLAKFPVNKTSLESKINKLSLDKITPKRVLDFGTDIKGLYGIEYLLYGQESSVLVEEFLNSKKRRKILQLIVNEFINDLKDRQEIWKNYAPKLIENKISKDDTDNSLNLIFGGIDNVIHFAWETKIGKAIRKNDIEALYSQKSLEIIRENIAITKKVYFDGGFAEKVEHELKYKELNNNIKKRYKKIEDVLNSISNPLNKAVKLEKEKLNTLIEELKALENTEFNKVEIAINLLDGIKEGDGD